MGELFQNPWILLACLTLSVMSSRALFTRWGKRGFALIQIASCYALFYHFQQSSVVRGYFLTYLSVALISYALVLTARRHQVLALSLFLFTTLILNRLAGSFLTLADFAVILGDWAPPTLARSGLIEPAAFVGFSYFCFRLILGASEWVRLPQRPPSLSEFMAFAFFWPHLVVGPLTPYRAFADSYRSPFRLPRTAILRALSRIAIGAAKYFFLSGLFYQLTFTRLHPTGLTVEASTFAVSMIAYTIFIYFNFSGFCDIMIGASYLCGIESKENFNAPLAASTLRDFWKRWHISLTSFLQTFVFNPAMKRAIRLQIPFSFSLILCTFLVFILMSLWHGFHLNYLIFGLLHAAGLSLGHVWPQQWRIPGLISRILTLSYVSLCFFFFENSWEKIEIMVSALTRN